MPVSLAPFVPSQPEVVNRMLKMAQIGESDVVFDLGCGDGRILFTAVNDFGVKKAVGYEMQRYLYERVVREIQKQKLEAQVSIFNDDLLKANISEATVITLYLTSSGNNVLKPKILKEAQHGTRVVSHSFEFSGWTHSKKDKISWHTIYLYTIPEAFITKRESKSFFSKIWALRRNE